MIFLKTLILVDLAEVMRTDVVVMVSSFHLVEVLMISLKWTMMMMNFLMKRTVCLVVALVMVLEILVTLATHFLGITETIMGIVCTQDKCTESHQVCGHNLLCLKNADVTNM